MNFIRFKSEDAGRLALFIVLAAFAVLGRVFEHAPNFTPVAAIGLLAGYLFRSRSAGFLAVLGAMFVSDLIIGYESVAMRVVVYTALFIPVLLGSAVKSLKGLKLGAGLVGSSLLSFKIVVDKAYHRLLGIHIVGSHATEMLSEVVVAAEGELLADTLARTIHAHPTLSEGIMEAAAESIGQAIHI